MKEKLFAAFVVLLASLANAEEPAQAALAASAGTWEGELYYLDYQSGDRFGIPLRIEATVTPDGATLTRKLTFTDPGNLVHAANLVTIDRETGELVEAYFREGRAELLRYEIVTSEFVDDTQWRVVYEQDGTDDDRPARIRHTVERENDRMTSSKKVRFLDEPGDFFFRNGTEVRLLQ